MIHLYRPFNKNKFLKIFQADIREDAREYNIKLKRIWFDQEGYLNIEVSGPDADEFTYFLKLNYGIRKNFADVDIDETLKGYVVDPLKVGFGVFINAGIYTRESNQIDVLLPLRSLRQQLFEGLKIPLRKMIKTIGIIDHFPIEVVVKSIDPLNKKIDVELSADQVELFNTWIEASTDSLFIIGATYPEISSALKKTNHIEDVEEIEPLGLLERRLELKPTTHATGLIPVLGPLLPYSRFSKLIPHEIKNLKKLYLD